MRHITVLGGGPAGLAAGYYARKSGLPFMIYEAAGHVGGNCITFRHGDFFFDSGAHRFHNKLPDATRELQSLLGDDFRKITAPSSIFYKGKFIDFPLSPLNLLKTIGPSPVFKAVLELIAARITRNKQNGSFKSFALNTYGESIAEWFLLGYSEKLWGMPSDSLSPKIAGNRMKGLNLRTFIIESLLGQDAKTEHLDGSFYYPANGIGEIPEKLAEFCGVKNIRKAAKITKILHGDDRILGIEVNGDEKIDTDIVISTLPIDRLLQMMEPLPDEETVRLGKALRYRHLILIVFFLDKDLVSENASIYFPDPGFPFTRIHEPKQRSPLMSPSDKTSLVTEIPCQYENGVWNTEDEELIRLVSSKLIRTGLIRESEIIDALALRIPYAYPVLELGFEENIVKIAEFLGGFKNLKLTGRNGRFIYSHIHDMMKMGKEIIEEFCAGDTHCNPV
ncbi:MAG: FAD-dependent oxidoreductase [Nitrospirota bacterium]